MQEPNTTMHKMLSLIFSLDSSLYSTIRSKWLCSSYVFLTSLFLLMGISSRLAFADELDKEDQAQNWYKVEVIIFKYLNFNPKITQYEPIPKTVTHYPNIPFIRVMNDAPLTSNQITALDSRSLDLYKSEQILTHDRNTRVIYFAGWKQILLENDHATRIPIRGDNTPEGYGLKGNLFLSKQRFLHARADLFLVEYEQPSEQSLPEWFYLSDALALPFTQLLIPNPSVDNSLASPRKKIIANMNQSIRLRRNEVHYIDHPAMGLLIEIIPTDPPYIPDQKLITPNTDSNDISPTFQDTQIMRKKSNSSNKNKTTVSPAQ